MNFNYNGLIYDNGVGYYCKNGRVCEDVTNIINIDGEWYYVIKGIVYNSNDPIVAKMKMDGGMLELMVKLILIMKGLRKIKMDGGI